MFLRLVGIIAAALLSHAASACDFDHAPSDRWSIVREAGVAWLKTPCGDRFYSLGVNVVDGGYAEREKAGKVYYSWRAFAPSLDAWLAATRRRLGDWGFNTAGAWSAPPQQLHLPTIVNLELGSSAFFFSTDPFDPATEARMMSSAREFVAPYRGSPYRIGYFSDNERGWWAGTLFADSSLNPGNSATKQRWVAMLRRRYRDDWTRFAADFQPPAGVGSWAELLAAPQATHMRAGGAGIAAVREWMGIVAEHYYAVTEAAIRAADPDALFFGDRLPIYYDPAAIRAEARHVDAIATNYNVDAGDGWIARYYFDGLRHLSGGKPVLVSEWFFAARENRTGNRNNGHLMAVDTQAERAAGAAAATLNFAALPDIVGTHWFAYFDDPKGGRPDGEDYDFGLVDIDDRPYERVTEALSEANRRAAAVHAAAVPPAVAAGPFVVPRAEIELEARSLTGWPKPASLLPPLHPSPGAARFGELYLTWSARGLALATIGQDYFDLNLPAYSDSGEFPLGESYRVEFGIDAGAGPRRFTLFFIPRHGDRPDHQNMTALLCAGPARQAIACGCTPVAGADSIYFGADQPRITAEMLVPWSALGIAPPAPGATLRADAAMTSWYRERWMSLSGRPPDVAMQDPKFWVGIKLDDDARVTPPPLRPKNSG